MEAKKHMIFPILTLQMSRVHTLAREESKHSRASPSSTRAMTTAQRQTTVNNAVCLFPRREDFFETGFIESKIQMEFHGTEIRSIRLGNAWQTDCSKPNLTESFLNKSFSLHSTHPRWSSKAAAPNIALELPLPGRQRLELSPQPNTSTEGLAYFTIQKDAPFLIHK